MGLDTTSFGAAKQVYSQIAFTLRGQSAHSNIWVDNRLPPAAQADDFNAVAAEFELAYQPVTNVSDEDTTYINGYLASPQNYVLTAFAGVDPSTNIFRTQAGPSYGASYLFVRYLADQYGGNAVLTALAQTALGGQDNVAAATGVPFLTLVRNWGMAMDLTGVSLPAGSPYAYTTLQLNGTYNSVVNPGQENQLNGPTLIQVPVSAPYAMYQGSMLFFMENNAQTQVNININGATSSGLSLGAALYQH